MSAQNSEESIVSQLEAYGHKNVVFCNNPKPGLNVIIAVRNGTSGGKVPGGIPVWPCKSEKKATHNMLRPSKSMTCKAAMTGVNPGGSNAVIGGDLTKDDTGALGCFIKNLNGEFIKPSLQLTENRYKATPNISKLSKMQRIFVMKASIKMAKKRIADIQKVKSSYQ